MFMVSISSGRGTLGEELVDVKPIFGEQLKGKDPELVLTIR